jgi:hypothetical protein
MALSFQEAEGCAMIWYFNTHNHPVSLKVILMLAVREFVSDAQQRLGLVNGAGMTALILFMHWI